MPSRACSETPLPAASPWRRPGVAVALLSALALCFRLFLLGSKSLWLDEAMSFHFARLDAAAFRHLLLTRELNMAPYYLLLREWLRLGSSESWLRLLSVIPAVLNIAVVYAIGARLWSHRVGVLAALLLTVNAAHVAYAQEVRAYALAVLLVSLSALLLLRGLGVGGGDAVATPWNWAAYALCSVAAIYCQFFAGFAIAAQLIALAACRSRRLPWRWLLASVLLIGVLIAPAAWFARSLREDPLSWVPALGFTQVFKSVAEQAGNPLALLVFLPLWYVAARRATGGSQPSDDQSGDDQPWAFRFALLWLSLPLVILLLVSLVKPVMNPRFLLMSVPAGALAAAAGYDSFDLSHGRKRWLLSAVLLISVIGVADYYRHAKQDWRGVTAYVLRGIHADDGVFFSGNCGPFGFDYYQRGMATGASVPLRPADELRVEANARYPRLWLLSCFGHPPTNTSEALAPHYQLTARQPFFQVEVRLYQALAPPH